MPPPVPSLAGERGHHEVGGFNATTLEEVKQKLQERGLRLGMKVPAGE